MAINGNDNYRYHRLAMSNPATVHQLKLTTISPKKLVAPQYHGQSLGVQKKYGALHL